MAAISTLLNCILTLFISSALRQCLSELNGRPSVVKHEQLFTKGSPCRATTEDKTMICQADTSVFIRRWSRWMVLEATVWKWSHGLLGEPDCYLNHQQHYKQRQHTSECSEQDLTQENNNLSNCMPEDAINEAPDPSTIWQHSVNVIVLISTEE